MQHKGIKPEECDLCGKKFPTKGLLTNHRRTHFKEKAFKCELCDEEFMRLVTLKKHVKYVHGHGTNGRVPPIYDDRPSRKPYGESKPFVCDECDVTFTSNGKFLAHQQTHRPNKQFKCDDCGMCFAKSYTLEVHRRMHTSVSPVIQASPVPVNSMTTIASVTPVLTIPATVSVPQTSNKITAYVKVPQRPIAVKREPQYNDPLAMATAAAQVTPDLVESLTLPEQHHPYNYHYSSQGKTMYATKYRK
ncbi:gastrula zinc finger protein XlCGF71.1-like [Macrobrachium nipponense]|uniref:gastrula zinc finger protein XlCGF71.1-like n=1 Tax=Macrobrachium nipponense TaxID=159736 RepID=UPI0030C8B85F